MFGSGRREVQLADRAGAIASILQPLLQQRFARIAGRIVDAVAMAMRIAPGEEADAGGDADGSLHERVREVGRLRGEAVQIRSADEAVAVGAEAVVAKLIGHDEQDVGLGGERSRRGPAQLQKTSPGEFSHRLPAPRPDLESTPLT